MAASPNNSTIPLLTQLVDSNNNIWTVVGGVVYQNGKLAGLTNNSKLLLWYNGVITYQNPWSWWSWINGAWVSIPTDPRITNPPPPPPPPPNTNTTMSINFSNFIAVANANQTSFVITTNNALLTSNSYIQAYRNGLAEIPGLHYNVTGNVLTFISGSRANDEVYVVWNH